MVRRKGRPRRSAEARKQGPDRKSLVKYVRGPRAVGSRRRTPACFIKGVESFYPKGRASRGAGHDIFCAIAHDVRTFHPGQAVAVTR